MFKEAFKYFKAKWPTPNFDNVVDVDKHVETDGTSVRLLDLSVSAASCELTTPPGLRPLHTWQCFELSKHPGLLIIRNPFSVQGQRYWIARCLRDYPRHPNVVNLNKNLFTNAAIEDWWRELQHCKDNDEARRLKISMRWTTLGYHHDWDTKVYSEVMHTKFPTDLADLSQYFALVLGYADYNAQAAIINYYPIGTTLAGHTDHSELDLAAPLFSFSFGQTAIFLIGGTTKEERPTALYLRSGDVLVMSHQSRLCYHAVPRIMKARTEPWNALLPIAPIPIPNPNCSQFKTDTTSSSPQQPRKKLRRDLEQLGLTNALYEQVADEHFWLPFKTYLNDSRINMNVRQVLSSGAERLHEMSVDGNRSLSLTHISAI